MDDLVSTIRKYFNEKQYTPPGGEATTLAAFVNEFDLLPERTKFTEGHRSMIHSVFLHARLDTLKDCDVLVGLIEIMRGEIAWLGDIKLGDLGYEALTGTKSEYKIIMRIEMTVSVCR